MSDQPDSAGEAPVPGAAPAPAPHDDTGQGLIARLEHDLAEARAAVAREARVLLRIASDSPVTSFTVGGVTVTKDASAVPPHMVSAVQDSAADAGVPIEEAAAAGGPAEEA